MCLFVQSTGQATNEILLLRGRRLYLDDPGADGLRSTYVQGWVVLSTSIVTSLRVPDLQAAFQFHISCAATCRNKNQPHLARWRDCCEQGRPSSARVAVVRVGGLVARALPEHAVFSLLR